MTKILIGIFFQISSTMNVLAIKQNHSTYFRKPFFVLAILRGKTNKLLLNAYTLEYSTYHFDKRKFSISQRRTQKINNNKTNHN